MPLTMRPIGLGAGIDQDGRTSSGGWAIGRIYESGAGRSICAQRAANGLGAGEIPRLARKAHNVAAGSSR